MKYFSKLAKLYIENIEDNLGYYIPDEKEPAVRRMITNETKNSFAIRHPFITGLPTLGIWPAVAKQKAVDRISRNMARQDAEVANTWRETKKEREIRRDQYERDRMAYNLERQKQTARLYQTQIIADAAKNIATNKK